MVKQIWISNDDDEEYKKNDDESITIFMKYRRIQIKRKKKISSKIESNHLMGETIMEKNKRRER